MFYGIRYGFDDGKQPVGTYEQNGWTFEIYDDELPLYVEDMVMDIQNAEWSNEEIQHNQTFLLPNGHGSPGCRPSGCTHNPETSCQGSYATGAKTP